MAQNGSCEGVTVTPITCILNCIVNLIDDSRFLSQQGGLD